MIIKMNNKSENFYNYMGRIFGSRIVQLKTNDRIYDDASKEWFIYLKDETPVACVSVMKNVIKNIYTTKDEYLLEILNEVKKDVKIEASIVPIVYEEIYKKAGLEVLEQEHYKNFVVIRGAKSE